MHINQPSIIVHGGAGDWRLGTKRIDEALTACRQAVAQAHQLMKDGGTALDAVETAVRLLEDCPVLDAGRGSYPNAVGDIEMDAFIMNGNTLDIGAIAAVRLIQNPISLARRVLHDSPHTFFVGPGAMTFARQIGYPLCHQNDLLVVAEDLQPMDIHDKETIDPGLTSGPPPQSPPTATLGDTVGAAAFDMNGDLAIATSTGGTRNKMPGRVGDSPLVGSGGYADNWTAAAGATGHGEALMKVVISKTVCDLVGQGLSTPTACAAAIRRLEQRVNGLGGLIAVDARGQVGYAFNTRAMPYAYCMGDGDIITGYKA
ncbi:MAG TPA: isoaspartyl peptidase/L-asparaginase [Anaerolineae bacterium]|nr:isoaspartyl peptidase/L-asparaginase [Anaerolineae bacterium]